MLFNDNSHWTALDHVRVPMIYLIYQSSFMKIILVLPLGLVWTFPRKGAPTTIHDLSFTWTAHLFNTGRLRTSSGSFSIFSSSMDLISQGWLAFTLMGGKCGNNTHTHIIHYSEIWWGWIRVLAHTIQNWFLIFKFEP